MLLIFPFLPLVDFLRFFLTDASSIASRPTVRPWPCAHGASERDGGSAGEADGRVVGAAGEADSSAPFVKASILGMPGRGAVLALVSPMSNCRLRLYGSLTAYVRLGS